MADVIILYNQMCLYECRRKTRGEKICSWIAQPYTWSSERFENWYFRPPPVRKFYASQAKAKRHKYKRYVQYQFPSNRTHSPDEDFLIKRRKQIEDIPMTSNDPRRKLRLMRMMQVQIYCM